MLVQSTSVDQKPKETEKFEMQNANFLSLALFHTTFDLKSSFAVSIK